MSLAERASSIRAKVSLVTAAASVILTVSLHCTAATSSEVLLENFSGLDSFDWSYDDACRLGWVITRIVQNDSKRALEPLLLVYMVSSASGI